MDGTTNTNQTSADNVATATTESKQTDGKSDESAGTVDEVNIIEIDDHVET